MNSAISFKTIFLLDCTNEFRTTSSGQIYELDNLTKNRHNIPPMKPISKSLYTCAVEAIFDYSRIVWDLFPNGERLIRLFAATSQAVHPINSWDVGQQNSEKLLDCFGNLTLKLRSIKLPADEGSPLQGNGFSQALNALSFGNETNCNLTNCGRIILITNLHSEEIVKSFQANILQTYNQHNQELFDKQKKQSATGSAINQLDVIVINTFPTNLENPFPAQILNQKLSENVTFSFHSFYSGLFLSRKLLSMTFDHYDLASTTVSGIPMKEEQNAGSSANYDVEIIHSKEAHTQFFNSKVFNVDFETFLTKTNRDGQDFKTLVLKWCTPKAASALEINYCIGTHRITAVDMTSRPSMCLINFLHNGKFVNLEVSRFKGSKFFSHMLQSHDGELFIHVLSSTRSLTEDSPSISESVGGRVTDYRINEFAEFMKKNHLIKIPDLSGVNHLEKAVTALKKQTFYWPISYGLTVFFNIRDQLPTFYQIISKPRISEQELMDLKQIIYNFVNSDTKGLSLPFQSNLVRNKSLKKEDFYRILWNEMEHVIRCFNESPEHQSVLQCLLDCKPRSDNSNLFWTIKEMENKSTPVAATTAVIKANPQHSDLSTRRINLSNILFSMTSLQELYISRLEKRNSKRRREFSGRQNCEGAKIVKLYPDLADEK